MSWINKACVIGAGTMGLGIAGQPANAGSDVLLLELSSAGENRNAICERALAVLPLTLMFVGGLKTVQTATLIVSLPLIFVGVLMTGSLLRQLRADHG